MKRTLYILAILFASCNSGKTDTLTVYRDTCLKKPPITVRDTIRITRRDTITKTRVDTITKIKEVLREVVKRDTVIRVRIDTIIRVRIDTVPRICPACLLDRTLKVGTEIAIQIQRPNGSIVSTDTAVINTIQGTKIIVREKP